MALVTLQKDESTEPRFKEGVLLLIDKPLEWTSFDVVKKLRYALCRALNVKKIKVGHAGTLDPLATGLLLICTGKYTKQIDFLQAQIKGYTGKLTLGGTTASYDLEEEILNPTSIDHLTEKELHDAAKVFKGEIDQRPPIYSAIRIGGERLYKKARKGESVYIPTRKVTINQFTIETNQLPQVPFVVECTKGTYIRSLAHDYGQKLGVGAYLSALRRTYIGEYHVKDAWQLEDLLDYLSNRFENKEICPS